MGNQGNADMHMHPHQSPISNMPNDAMGGVPGNMNVQGKQYIFIIFVKLV